MPAVRRSRQLVAVLIASASIAAAARAQTCSPTGAPVALTSNHHYFSYKGATLPLLGMSYEYLCHIAQPQRAAQYCALSTFASVFSILQADKNNLVRNYSILNHSPGMGAYGAPFANEQPFVYVAGKWNLGQLDTVNLGNLDRVLCDAYNKGIIVELTLLDPWDGNWSTSPFNPANTVSGQGFTAQKYFASFDDPVHKTDTVAQNITARSAQKAAVAAVVNQLKKYPNLIWEIANEPDLNTSMATAGQVIDWQTAMLATIQANDASHLVMINGHMAPSFGWQVPGVKLESAHYTEINNPGVDGAIAVFRDASIAGQRAGLGIGFDEGQAIPNLNYNFRTADDVRAEAWEFAMYTGGLFAGYSYDRSVQSSQDAATQLGVLYSFLKPGIVSTTPIDLTAVQQASCNGASDWCAGVPAWGMIDRGTCFTQNANAYWSTMASTYNYALYIHHALPMSQVLNGPPKNDGYHEFSCGNGSTTGYQTGLQFRVTVGGCWKLQWSDPKTGAVWSSSFSQLLANTLYSAPAPPFYRDDIAVLLSYFQSSCQ